MKNRIIDRIKRFARNELIAAYGYCGVLENEDLAMLNATDENGNDIVIKIESKPKKKIDEGE